MKLKLAFPIKGTVTQYFGQNGNTLYKSDGLMGHPAIDIVSIFNDPIRESVIGYNKKWIYSTLNRDNPDLMKYRAVCELVEADDGVFEVIYGHCNNINCQLGEVATGTQIATEGNTGDVFVNGVEVTKAEKDAGSKAGTHIHFQLRAVEKVKSYGDGVTLIGPNGNVYIDSHGFYYIHKYPNNGYRSCIDPLPFIDQAYDITRLVPSVVVPNKFQYSRNFGYGSFGTDVYTLQKRLVKEGYATFVPTGFFGEKTRTAVKKYQAAKWITPTGYVGPITRSYLNL